VSRFWRVLLVIVAVAFGVRVAYVAFAKAGPCTVSLPGGQTARSPSECAVGDQIFYNSEANFVADGHGFNEPFTGVLRPGTEPGPAADHPPLTVTVLAPVSWLSERPPVSWIIDEPLEDHVREHRYAMVVLGTASVLLVGLLGRRAARSDTVGLVAAGIAALAPNVWVNDGLVMSETVTVLTVVGAMLAAFALRDRPGWWRAAALGALCGLAALARAELLLLVPLLAIPAALTVRGPARARAELAVVATGVALLALAPWVVFNLARFDDRTFVSTNDGIALLGSNCEGVYHGTGTGLTAPVVGAGGCLTPPPPGDQSVVAREYRQEAFDYMRAHKGRVPAVVAARIGRTWGVFRPGDMVSYNVGEGRERWVTTLGMIAYYPTLIAAIGGVVVLARRRARFALGVLLVPALIVTVGSAATYGQTRFRAAAEPSLAVLAAVGVVALIDALRSRRASRSAIKVDSARAGVAE
jgi:4-amino-4-deoxy-L-arabinose transferase-like glycosyltransferase